MALVVEKLLNARKFPTRMTTDSRIAEIAYRQHGNVTRRQLLRLGMSSSGIAHRVKSGRLIRLYAGVYAVGHAPTTPLARAAAAVLACAPGAVLSHDSGEALWGWRSDWRLPFEVTAHSGHERAGIRVHRCELARWEIARHRGIWVTSPARTVLDLASRQPTRRALTRLVNNARASGFLKLEALADQCARSPRHPGTKILVAFIEHDAGIKLSELEFDFEDFCLCHGLPRPLTNVYVAGYKVDAWFPDERVIVELDSKKFHLSEEAFETDRERDAHHLALGIPTVRLTRERLRRAPAREAGRLKRILTRRGRGPV